MIYIYTSAGPNYLGKVRVLRDSLRQHCPEMRFHWLVADVRSDELLDQLSTEEVDEAMFVDDLQGAPNSAWLFQHNIVELSTAIKPEAALSLLGRDDCELLLYIDPDIVVFSALDDLVRELRSASVVLTPHLLKPEKEMDAVLDHELCALRHGVFNLGFVGVKKCAEGTQFLEWWRDRCRDFCWSDWRSGVFTDQKWIDFAPIFFPNVSILRSPRFNVAPWNINQRQLSGTFDEGFDVDGEPLGFYHFTGFDSGAHKAVLGKYAPDNESLEMLITWYERRTADLKPSTEVPWNLGSYAGGDPIAPQHRELYRDHVDLQQTFPDPFRVPTTGSSLMHWMKVTAPVEHPDLFPVAQEETEALR